MKVSIKDLGIPLDIKSRGIEIDVSGNNGNLGDLYVTMRYLIWCRGRTARANGDKLSWAEFMKLMENLSKTKRFLKRL
jgi:hypothetical protein